VSEVYLIVALLAATGLLWGVAVWASFREKDLTIR
jgi:hypothetical protein